MLWSLRAWIISFPDSVNFLRAGNGISGCNHVILGELMLLLLAGALVSEGTMKMARSIFWPKFVHDVAMDIYQRLVDVNSLEYIGKHAI